LGYHTLALLLTETKGNNLIITTNFDTLVEDSLYLYTNKKPLVINHDLLAQYVDHNKRTRPIIAKLHHGLFFDPMNTNEVNDEWIKAWSNVLAEVFRNYIPVVIGYGGGDTSLMRILNSDAIRMREGILWCTRNENGYESDNPEVCAVVEKHNGFFVKIKGFDDLMLRIGNAMFLEKISTEATKNHLEAQTMKRIKAYEDKYKELTKDDLNGKTNLSLSADDYYQKGNHLMARGKYSKAIEFLSKAIDLDPTYTLAYRDRGLVKFLMSKFGTAIEDLTKAIELDQTDYSAYTIRGIVWEALKKYNEAIEDFSKAIVLNPTDISPYNNRGNAWASCGKHDNAVEDYSRAIEIDPENFISYVGRGNSWNDLKDYDRAITDFSKALQINPINSAAYNGRGNSWTYLKQYNKAIEDYSQAIAMNSDYIDAYRNRSVAYHFLGNNDLAEADRKKAAELESKTT
jgi:tetratricopeptide (TPR) repeat protein